VLLVSQDENLSENTPVLNLTDWSTFNETDNWDRCYNKFVTKIYILLEYGLIPGLDEFEHNN
jgi:hypothetical protein